MKKNTSTDTSVHLSIETFVFFILSSFNHFMEIFARCELYSIPAFSAVFVRPCFMGHYPDLVYLLVWERSGKNTIPATFMVHPSWLTYPLPVIIFP
jgi:hypothetical protein